MVKSDPHHLMCVFMKLTLSLLHLSLSPFFFFEQSFLTLGNLYSWQLKVPLVSRLQIQN